MISKVITAILPHLPKKFVWMFSKKYIAGDSLSDAIKVSQKLNNQGINVTIDLLGEFIENMSQADYYKRQYLDIINTFENKNVEGTYSLKPTSFGLLIDREQCYKNIHEIVALASAYNSFVRIDMEDSPCVDLEIELYKRLKAEFPQNVGLVLQAYLYRTEKDIDHLLTEHSAESPLNFRLCKGIYIEDESIAIKDPKKINENYLLLLEKLLINKVYVGIATHDDFLIKESKKLIQKHNVSDDMFEYQMLYGVTPHLRDQIVKSNKKMRVYIPFGKDWLKYSIRRLKENPAMTSHILKSLFN
ncbi:proline dehydrogenase family protein [Saccharicrinis aurantiacus]|uniref:proline dehydrogenase family protein n=1 Tax=Saccharicrinis aurantiacus TaxID=1849719 RepID=UPI002493460F|nr:proline dehydrogenase family protein [Saccharicrinis aurantiacus]